MTMRKLREPLPIIEMQIVGSVADVGADAAKRMPPGSRYRFFQPVAYRLEDGEQFEGRVTALTKPKLAARIADNARYITNQMMYADQWELDGQPHWSISTRFTINLG